MFKSADPKGVVRRVVSLCLASETFSKESQERECAGKPPRLQTSLPCNPPTNRFVGRFERQTPPAAPPPLAWGLGLVLGLYNIMVRMVMPYSYRSNISDLHDMSSFLNGCGHNSAFMP